MLNNKIIATNPEKLIQDKISEAKILAAKDAWRISLDIKKYEITDQKALAEIAMIAVTKNGWAVSEYIKNYGIEDQKILVEIAKIAVANDSQVSDRIGTFGIVEEKDRIAIAMIAAAHYGWYTTVHIKNYKITDQKALVEIAKIAAKSDDRISERIQEYGIEDADSLIEIAKIEAAKDGECLSKYIQNYCSIRRESQYHTGYYNESLEHNPVEFAEIAKIAATQNGELTSKYIKDYRLNDQEPLLNIFLTSINQNIDSIKYRENYNFSELIHLYINDIINDMNFKKNNEDNNENDLYGRSIKAYPELQIIMKNETLENDLKLIPEEYNELKSFIQKLRNPELQIQMLTLLAKISISSKLAKLPIEEINASIPIIKAIFDLRDPVLKVKIADIFLDFFFKHNSNQKISEWLNENIDTSKLKFTQSGNIIIGKLLCESLNGNSFDNNSIFIMDKVITTTRKNISQNDRMRLYNSLMTLKESSLSDSDKQRVISLACSRCKYIEDPDNTDEPTIKKVVEILIKQLSIVSMFINLGKTDDLLKKQASTDFEKQLKQLVENDFGVAQVADLWNKLLKNVFSLRDRDGIFHFGAKVCTVSYQAKNLFSKFLTAVLEGTYSEFRYNTERIHLDKVFGNNQELEANWQKGTSLTYEEVATNEKSEESHDIDVTSYLRQKILADKHLEAKDYSYIHAFLSGNKSTSSNIKTAIEDKQTELKQKSKLPAAREELPLLSNQLLRLRIQEMMLTLLKAEDIKSKRNIINEINQLVEKKQVFPEVFLADLQGLSKQLIGDFKSDRQKWSVEDTDRYEDMLLLGVEVDGSCQSIYKNIDLSKCLLAYLTDGKNRALIIRGDDGRIKGRAIFRILSDTKAEKPVLFLERTYVSGEIGQTEAETAILEIAKRRAQSLGLTLVGKYEGGEKFNNILKSLGGNSPFEYIDALGNKDNRSTFEISSGTANVIYP